jgi:CheY-like chemotaxis protein/nitrogen-specific signal transduction histidine kinase
MAKTKASGRSSKTPKRSKRPAARGARAMEASLAGLAHDIRTPLGGILALSELLASSEIGARERGWAEAIKGTAEHLATLTTLIVDAVRADTAPLVLRADTFRPRELMAAVTASFTARAEAKGLLAEVQMADGVPEAVVGDAPRLRAALENLIDNAVKFTETGTVRMEVCAARAARGRVRLDFAVTDTGIGLTQAEIRRLFRPFAQGNEEIARRHGGAGLGLVLVKRLAKALGGDLKVSSRPDRGSTFCLSVVVAPADVTAMLVDSAGRPAMASPGERRLRLLCAEDNPYGRVILNTILSELGHHVDFVGSGEAALKAVDGGYDAVLMDVALSGIDGIEATRRIRALPLPGGRIPVVGISGRTRPADEASARAAGMDAYLTKPVSPRLLAETLARLANADGPEPAR